MTPIILSGVVFVLLRIFLKGLFSYSVAVRIFPGMI